MLEAGVLVPALPPVAVCARVRPPFCRQDLALSSNAEGCDPFARGREINAGKSISEACFSGRRPVGRGIQGSAPFPV